MDVHKELPSDYATCVSWVLERKVWEILWHWAAGLQNISRLPFASQSLGLVNEALQNSTSLNNDLPVVVNTIGTRLDFEYMCKSRVEHECDLIAFYTCTPYDTLAVSVEEKRNCWTIKYKVLHISIYQRSVLDSCHRHKVYPWNLSP